MSGVAGRVHLDDGVLSEVGAILMRAGEVVDSGARVAPMGEFMSMSGISLSVTDQLHGIEVAIAALVDAASIARVSVSEIITVSTDVDGRLAAAAQSGAT